MIGNIELTKVSLIFYVILQRTEDQKLIYSGQLLHDSVILKDVLRRYEGQETHTVHLVCTPSRVPTKAQTRMSDSGQISASSSRGKPL